MDNFTTENEIKILTQELEYLQNEESEINELMNTLKENLDVCSKDDTQGNYSYVTLDDIKKIQDLSGDIDQSFLVIKAPQGATLEVPEGADLDDRDFPYKLSLMSDNEEILTYIVSNDTQESYNTNSNRSNGKSSRKGHKERD